ncbi:hypothetical protein R6Q59_011989 [Mikania micrantha]
MRGGAATGGGTSNKGGATTGGGDGRSDNNGRMQREEAEATTENFRVWNVGLLGDRFTLHNKGMASCVIKSSPHGISGQRTSGTRH